MPNNTLPLYYAILKHFEGGGASCAQDVMDALAPVYANYKLFTKKDIGEALDTAKENGLLDEASFNLDGTGELRIYYQMTDFGQDMIKRYLT